MSSADPGDLALAVHAGMDGSMERLVRTYQDQLYSYARHMLRNSFDAQEVTQDAFVGAYRALTSRYDVERCRNLVLRPWLFQITRNLAYNRLRARGSVPEEPIDRDGAGRTEIRDPRTGTDSADALDTELLDKAIARLKPSAREVIVLRFVEELSYAEIAASLGITEASVRGKVFRALRHLKKLLQRR